MKATGEAYSAWRSIAAVTVFVAAALGATADPAAAAATFSNAPDVPVGLLSYGVAVGDFNGDAKADMAVTNRLGNTVSVRLGDGAGSFAAAPDLTGMNSPHHLAIGDFNSDTKADLAVGNAGLDVSIRLGDGMGNFAVAPNVAGFIASYGLEVADVNRDAKADLISLYGDTVMVRLGDGAGNFSAAPDVAIGDNRQSLAVGDFNGDGNADFVVPGYYEGAQIAVRLGDGAGNFTAAPDVPAGTKVRSVAVADFNNDAKADFVVANEDRKSATVLLGDGAGNFAVAPKVNVVELAFAVAVADFDGDGNADFAVISRAANVKPMSVRLGDGAGNFAAAPDVPVGSKMHKLAVGDFNGDDHPDLAAVEEVKVLIRLNQDTTPSARPTCRILATLAGPPKQIVVGTSDLRSGIRSIAVTGLVNATARVEPFASMGRFTPEVQVVFTKIDQSQPAIVRFKVVDGAGQQLNCA